MKYEGMQRVFDLISVNENVKIEDESTPHKAENIKSKPINISTRDTNDLMRYESNKNKQKSL